ncbi:hypothetical protein NDU88_008657 [Pleurodeles waltl]|uniref:Uncharacterized protein n=1 Tax=Pleurodeles waltl TaxID=8319 RepID=A0AAV7QSF3_PLEWA|nr:hypothetical protein NDU88_008657 [Pleurodeles waltl]
MGLCFLNNTESEKEEFALVTIQYTNLAAYEPGAPLVSVPVLPWETKLDSSVRAEAANSARASAQIDGGLQGWHCARPDDFKARARLWDQRLPARSSEPVTTTGRISPQRVTRAPARAPSAHISWTENNGPTAGIGSPAGLLGEPEQRGEAPIRGRICSLITKATGGGCGEGGRGRSSARRSAEDAQRGAGGDRERASRQVQRVAEAQRPARASGARLP